MDGDARSDETRLSATVARFADRGYAVLDGGLFDDLPSLLKQNRLFARSLFLDSADREIGKAGPSMVALAQHPQAASRVADLVGAKPAATYWRCVAGEAVLWRHLRTLNMAKIPSWAAIGKPQPDEVHPAEVFEAVVFRHWDPRVLGAILPVLDAAQFAKLLGPAEDRLRRRRLRRRPSCRQGAGLAARPDRPPDDPLGTDRRHDRAAREGGEERMGDYLRASAPEQTSALNDDDLRALVVRYRESGARMGLGNERALCIWGFLMASSGDRFEHLPHVSRRRTGRPRREGRDAPRNDDPDRRDEARGRLMPWAIPVAEGVGELGAAAFEGTEAVSAATAGTAGTAGAAAGTAEVLTAAQQAERLRKALALARALALAAAASQACKTCCRRTIVISHSAAPKSAEHVDQAQAAGYPSVLTYEPTGAAARRRASIAPYPSRFSEGFDRDEYPPATFAENGGVASVKYVPYSDNRRAGNAIMNGLRGATPGMMTGP